MAGLSTLASALALSMHYTLLNNFAVETIEAQTFPLRAF